VSDYRAERDAHPQPINLVITTRAPSKWRFVDLETNDIWQSDGSQMVRAQDRRVVVVPAADARVTELINRPDLKAAVTAKRSELRQADRAEEIRKLRDQLEQVRAAVRLLYPDEMTPNAQRMLTQILDPEL
jgi:hypothetical protein